MSSSVVGAFDEVVSVVESRSSVAFSKFVERGVRGDAIRPGTERRSTIEAWKVADDLDERFLAGIVGITAASSDTTTDGVNPVVVRPQQLVERVAITALCGGNQCAVVEMCGDARRLTNRSVHDGDLTEATAIRIGVGTGGITAEFLQHDEHVACRGRWHR